MVNCAPPITIAITITSLPCVRSGDQNLRDHAGTHGRIYVPPIRSLTPRTPKFDVDIKTILSYNPLTINAFP